MSSPIEAVSTDNVARDAASDTTNKPLTEKEVAARNVTKAERSEQRLSRSKAKGSPNVVSNRLLSIGFVFALVLALLCLSLSVMYLFQYLNSANTGISQVLDKVAAQQIKLEIGQLETLINGRLVMARLGLLSCGVLAGVAFGFLGFALFLLGIKETMNVDFDSDTYRAKVARMSPGVFLLVVAAVLIGVCATRETPFGYSIDATRNKASGEDRRDPGAPASTHPNVTQKPESKGAPPPKITDDQP